MSGCAGRARQADAGTGSGARRWDARGAGARGSRRHGRAAGKRAGARTEGRAERAGQGRPGRLGWPWAVHSVHSTHCRSVLTRFFFLSHQMNTVHCKIKFFRKKKYLLNSNKIK